MAKKDDFRLVLSDHAEVPEQPDTGTAWRRAVVSSRTLKASLLVVTAAAIAVAVVSMGNPLALFADATAFLGGASTPKDGTDQKMPDVQSNAGPEGLPPPANDAPADNESALPSDTASHTEDAQAPAQAQALLSQFQAWAASQDTKAEVQPIQPAHKEQAVPAPETQPADPAQDARQESPPVQRRQLVGRVKNAQAEIRAKQNRAKLRQEQNVQMYFRPAPVVREPDPPPVQNARPPSFLESLGIHN
jgi:hypothetical protein